MSEPILRANHLFEKLPDDNEADDLEMPQDADWEHDPTDPDEVSATTANEVTDQVGIKAERMEWVKENLKWEEYSELWCPKYCSFGDYDNSGITERANSKVLDEKFDFVKTVTGGYGSVTTGISEEDLAHISQDDWESFVEMVESLENYPQLDDDVASNMEMEAQQEAWDDWGFKDFKKECFEKAVSDFDEYVVVRRTPAQWEELRNEMEQNGDFEWYYEGGGAGFRTGRAAEKALEYNLPEQERIHIETRFAAEQSRLWVEWVGSFFETQLRARFANVDEVQHVLAKSDDTDIRRIFDRLMLKDDAESPWLVDVDAELEEPAVSVKRDGVTALVVLAEREDVLAYAKREDGAGQMKLPLTARETLAAQLAANLLEDDDEPLDWAHDPADVDASTELLKSAKPETFNIYSPGGRRLMTVNLRQALGLAKHDFIFKRSVEDGYVIHPLADIEHLLVALRDYGLNESEGDEEPPGEEALDWTPDPADPDDASASAMKRGHDSTEDVYEDSMVRIFRPMSISTYNRYAEMAGVPVASHMNRIADWMTFIVLNKNPNVVLQLKVVILDFNNEGRSNSSGTTSWLTLKGKAGIYVDVTKSIRKGLSSYALKQIKEAGDYDSREWLRLLFQVGTMAQINRVIGIESRIEPESVWPVVAAQLEAGNLANVKRLCSRAGISLKDVVFRKGGFYLLWSDWDDMTDFFEKEYRNAAEKVFGYDIYDWYDSSHMKWEDVYDRLDEKSMAEIRKLLVGMPWVDPDTNEKNKHTLDSLEELSDRDIKDMFEENEDEFEGITDAIRQGGWQAEEQSLTDAVYKGYTGEVESALSSTSEWLNRPVIDKATGKQKVEDGKKHYTSKLAFFFKPTAVQEWLSHYTENISDDCDATSLHDLALNGTDKATPADDYSHRADFDDESFNDMVRDNLPNYMDWHPSAPDPAQPDLPWKDPPVTVTIYSEHYPDGASVQMTKSSAEKYFAEHPEKMSKEAWQAYVAKQ